MMQERTIDLYSTAQHAETTEGITAMAIRFDIRGNDVIHALWLGSRDTVWAKLALDLKDRKEEIKREKAAMLKMGATDE